MVKSLKILTMIGLITAISTVTAYGLDDKSAMSEEIVKNIYELKVEQKNISDQISQINSMIESKKSQSKETVDVEVISLSFVEDNENVSGDLIAEDAIKSEIEGLESLKISLSEKVKNLELEESQLKSDIGDNFNYGCWPVEGFYDISSPYGYRVHPRSKEKKFHKGIDIPADYRKDIVSTDYGVVTFSGQQNGYGNVVIVTHFDGKVSKYAHNSENLVKEGDLVQKGQTIAKIGSTGNSTGNHVHFEVLLNDELQNPIDVTMK